MQFTSRGLVLALVVGFVPGLAACGPDPDDSLMAAAATTTAALQPVSDITYPANGTQAAVTAMDNNFLSQTLSVAAGTEVVFTNNGRNPHNVVPVDDPTASEWGVLEADFQPKDVYSHVFDRPGTFTYYCTIHGTPTAAMFGTITVTAP